MNDFQRWKKYIKTLQDDGIIKPPAENKSKDGKADRKKPPKG